MIGIIFSRNRAAQLDCLLRSFLVHCHDQNKIQLNILYLTTNSSHEAQYQQLMHSYSNFGFIRFIRQKDFRQDVLKLLLEYGCGQKICVLYKQLLKIGVNPSPINKKLYGIKEHNYVMFLVDDNIFVRDFGLGEIQKNLDEQKNAIGFSLRLGTNINYCYPLNKDQFIPDYSELKDNILIFKWTDSNCDFGYPLEVSSSVYRLEEILPLLCSISFKNPNQLEDKMSSKAFKFKKSKPFLLCYYISVAFCNPINLVQTAGPNRVGSSNEYSSEELSLKFDQGFRINADQFNGFVPFACHQEVDLVFSKKNN